MGELTNDRGMGVTPGGGLTVALPGLGELVHADPGLRAWLRHRTCPGLNTDGLPGLTNTYSSSAAIRLLSSAPSYGLHADPFIDPDPVHV